MSGKAAGRGRFRRFYAGEVELRITGLAPERLVNMAMSQGVYMWDVRQEGQGRLRATMIAADFFHLRQFARRCRCRVRILAKRGAPFIGFRLRFRRMFIAGLLLTCLGLYLAAGFLWQVTVTGGDAQSQVMVQQWLYDRGVRPGIWKSELAPQQLQKQLLLERPELSWVGIRIHGVHLIAEIVEGEPPPQMADKSVPADLVADRDAVIEEIRVYAGEALVKEGDTVRKGQVLIRGLEGAANQHARGEVTGRIWLEGKATASLREEVREYTGRIGESRTLILGGWRVPVDRTGEVFERFERKSEALPLFGKLFFPAYLEREIYLEQTVNYAPVSEEEARQRAEALATEVLEAKWPETLTLVDKRVEYSIMDDMETVQARVIGEARCPIGISVPR